MADRIFEDYDPQLNGNMYIQILKIVPDDNEAPWDLLESWPSGSFTLRARRRIRVKTEHVYIPKPPNPGYSLLVNLKPPRSREFKMIDYEDKGYKVNGIEYVYARLVGIPKDGVKFRPFDDICVWKLVPLLVIINPIIENSTQVIEDEEDNWGRN